MAMPGPIRILHLSDFHFREQHQWDATPVLYQLTEAIRSLVDNGQKPHVVAFTGDIAFSGKAAEYELAQRWIEQQLLPVLAPFAQQNLLFVPGNHDVDRSKIDFLVKDLQAMLLAKGAQEFIAEVLGGSRAALLLEPQAAFLKFANQYRLQSEQHTVPWGKIQREFDGCSIAFLGLNSAWMSCGDEDQGRLLVSRYQLNEVLKASQKTHFVIALMHHPYAYLRDFDRMEIQERLRKDCHLVLSGHLHEQESLWVTDQRWGYIELAAGSVYGGSRWRNGFQLIEIDPDAQRVQIHLRVWERSEWIIDRNRAPDNGVVTFDLKSSTESQRHPSVPHSLVSESNVSPNELASLKHTNLTLSSDKFVGREQDLQELTARLSKEHIRLVTLTGVAGTGKTRLSYELGIKLLDAFEGGVWFADLTEAKTSAGVASAVASAFGVPLTGKQTPQETVANILEYRKPLLLILNNFEQVVDHAVTTVGLWRQKAPHVRFLVTSRKLLGLGGENVYTLQPLPTPSKYDADIASPEHISRYDAVKLFVERAGELGEGFTLSAANAKDVATICAELEGLPLSIELAVAKVRSLQPRQIVENYLGEKFQLLKSSRRDIDPRHRTLEAAIESSFSLLVDWEQRAFLQCNLFRGGFFLEAAESIFDLSDSPAASSLVDVIQSLQDASLLRAYDTAYGKRYTMYVALREYCERKWHQLATPEDKTALQHRYAEYYIGYSQQWKDRISSQTGIEAFDRIELEMENLIAVHDLAFDSKDPETAAQALVALAQTLHIRRPNERQTSRLERALAALNPDLIGLRVELLLQLSKTYFYQGMWDRAAKLADDAVSVAKDLGRSRIYTEALHQQGDIRVRRGNIKGALEAIREAESITRELHDENGHCVNLELQGRCQLVMGNIKEALALYDHAYVLAQKIDNQYLQAKLLSNQASAFMDTGDYERALEYCTRADRLARNVPAISLLANIALLRANAVERLGDTLAALKIYDVIEQDAREYGNKDNRAYVLGNRGHALMYGGNLQEAFAAFSQSRSLLEELGERRSLGIAIGNQAIVLFQLAQFDEARNTAKAALDVLSQVGAQQSLVGFITQGILARSEAALGNCAQAQELAISALQLATELGFTSNHADHEVRENVVALNKLIENCSHS